MHRESTRLLRLLAVTALFSGCGGTQDSSNGLFINAALGLSLIQSPITVGFGAEGPVNGMVFVTQSNLLGTQVPATLTVNGVEVPQQSALGVFLGYDFTKVSIPNAAPGEPLTLHASYETYSAEMSLPCPSAVNLTAPADNSQAAAGDSVNAAWTGSVDYDNVIKPDILVFGFDPSTGMKSEIGFADRVESGKSSDGFALPDPQGAPQWLVALYVPGDAVNDAAGSGFCMLERRAHLLQK